MKRIALISAMIAMGAICASCGKGSGGTDGGGGNEDIPTVGIRVSGIADNKATVSASLETGRFYGAKIVEGVRVSTVPIDYTKEIALIGYVESNGKDAALPYTGELFDLIFEQDYLCAVIVYDSTGRACSSAYVTFTADGAPDGISDENSAGNLEDNPQ